MIEDSTTIPSPRPATRREQARQARDAFPPMGVFAIRDLQTGRVRVLASRNVPGALNRTRFELRLGSHPDRTTQAAWREGGDDRVRFDVLDMVKQRSEPDFDHAAELRALEALYRSELEAPGGAA